jgi:hypothetical protein
MPVKYINTKLTTNNKKLYMATLSQIQPSFAGILSTNSANRPYVTFMPELTTYIYISLIIVIHNRIRLTGGNKAAEMAIPIIVKDPP